MLFPQKEMSGLEGEAPKAFAETSSEINTGPFCAMRLLCIQFCSSQHQCLGKIVQRGGWVFRKRPES